MYINICMFTWYSLMLGTSVPKSIVALKKKKNKNKGISLTGCERNGCYICTA